MRKFAGLSTVYTRSAVLIIGVLLCTVAFGIVAWNIGSAAEKGELAEAKSDKTSTGKADEPQERGANPGLIKYETWRHVMDTFNLEEYRAREERGEIPSQAGPVIDDSPSATDVLVNNNAGATGTGNFTQSETDLIAFGNTVVAGFNDSGSNVGGNRFTGFSRSTDGGLTFTDGGTLPTSAGGDAGDPVIARNNTTGRLYFSTLGFSVSTIQMFRSDDNGITWMAPVNATPGGSSEDKQWHTVDNFAGAGNGNVYMMSRRFGATGGGAGIYVFRSTDNGDTFTPTNGVNIVAGFQGAFIAVGPDHSVYAFWFAGATLQMRKSTDQALTFGPAVTVATGLVGGTNGDHGLTGQRQGLGTFSGFRSSAFPHVAINPVSGNIYVTWATDAPAADKCDVFLTQSTNGGATWSAPARVNDDATTTDQWQPTIAVSTDGARLGIFYYSRQEDTVNNNLFKFYGRTGTIAGGTVTFAPSFAVSDVASMPEFGRDTLINTVYMGDYNHAVATPGFFHVTWADNRNDLVAGPPRKDPNVYYDKIALGLAVASTVPAVGSISPTIPTSYVVNFTDPVNNASVQASDFTVDGIPATGVTMNTSSQYTFTYAVAPFANQGVHTMAMAAGSVTQLSDGSPLIAFTGPFTFQLPAPVLARGAISLPTGNGIIEPNECNLMNIPITNNGNANATAVSAVLSTTTPGVTIPQPNSAYPNILQGATQTNTTPFQISTTAGIACGTNISFTLVVTYTGGGSPVTFNFSSLVGQTASPNYVFASSASTIPAGGVLVAGSQADDVAVSITLPAGFSSTVYGTAVASLSASTNGLLAVNGTAATTFTNTPLPATLNASGATLAPFWDDLNSGATNVLNGGIFTNTIGSAPNRQFIVEWRSHPFNTGSAGQVPTVVFAIVLTEGSDTIRYVYQLTGLNANLNGSSATVGAQAANTGTQFTQFSFDTPSLTPGQQLTGTRPAGICNSGSGGCGGPTGTPTTTPTNTPTATPTATPTPTPAPGACTFSNGGLNPTALSKSGVAAPAGFFWSEVQNNAGNTTVSNTNAGFAVTQGSFRLADNFTLTQTCTLQTAAFYGYQTGSPATPSPFTAMTLQIWNGRPGDAGASVVFGDTTTNRLASSVNSTFFRIFNTIAPPPGTPPGTTRTIWRNTVTINTVLAPGTYWFDWASTVTGAAAHFAPGKTIEGARNAAGDNARQQTVGTGVWTDALDAGNPATPPSLPQDFPFDVVGTGGGVTPTPTATPTLTPTPTATPTPGAGVCTASYTGPPVAVPDNVPAGVNITLPVAGVGTLTDLNFRFDTAGACDGTLGNTNAAMDHTFIGDLTFRLTAPNGTTSATFQARRGGVRDNICLSTLDDEGGFPNISTLTSVAGQPQAGNFSPETTGMLSLLDGTNANGNWTLNVSDNFVADTGSMRRFSLVMTGTGCAGGTPTPTATPTNTPTATPTPVPTNLVQFSAASYVGDESLAADTPQHTVVTVTRTGVTTGVTTVNATRTGGTANVAAVCAAGVDAAFTSPTLVTFNAGELTKTFTIANCPDTLYEVDETILLSLTGAVGGGVGAQGTTTVIVNDTANQFRNTTPIDTFQGIQSAPYPSNITVAGGPTNVHRVRVTLYDLYHAFPDNLKILLVNPQGRMFIVMGDAGGSAPITQAGAVTLTFTDLAGQVLPDSTPLTRGKFEPTNWQTTINDFPAPAPAGPYAQPGNTVGGTIAQTLFGNFGQLNGNGLWSLYIRDDNGGNAPEAVNGQVQGGWGLELLAATAAGVEVSGRVTTPDGRGLRNAVVSMVDSQGVVRTATTSSFGYYSFDSIEAGSSVVMSVQSRRYRFAPRIIQVVDTLTDVDFQGQE